MEILVEAWLLGGSIISVSRKSTAGRKPEKSHSGEKDSRRYRNLDDS